MELATHWVRRPSGRHPLQRGQFHASALLVADLAVVPVVPSPPDLWAGIAIRQVLNDVTVLNGADQ